MAGPSSPRQLHPPCGSSIHVNKSSSKPPLRTYSKRNLRDISEPLNKKQRIENHPTASVKSSTKSGVYPTTPTLPKKRSISEYFGKATHTRAPSSPQSSLFSSDPIQKNFGSPPSSPPSPYISPTAVPKKRARRRLTSRPPLTLTSMSDLNAGGSNEHRKSNDNPSENGSLLAKATPRTSCSLNTSPQGLEHSSEQEGNKADRNVKADHDADDVDHRDQIDIPGARICLVQEAVTPSPPHPLHVLHGTALPPSSPLPVDRNGTFSSDNTYVGGSIGSDVTLVAAEIVVARASNQSQTVPSLQSTDDLARREMLLRIQPSDPDMMFGFDEHQANRNFKSVPGTIAQLTRDHTQTRAHFTDPGPTTQSDVAGPSVPQVSLNSATARVIPPIVQAASNIAQGSSNLVQTQLDLGRSTNLTCDICGFTFNRTLLADVRSHNDYHDALTLGEPVACLTASHRYHLQSINTRIGQGDYVVMVDRSSTEGWKNLAMDVLDRYVDKELGSIEISSTVLWSSIADPASTGPTSEAARVDRFKIYMYVRRYIPREGRVVSLLLAERITTGFETNHIQVQADEFGPWPSIVRNAPPVVSTKAHEAVLGVNKFWTIRSSRRNGYGKTLLNQARQTFVPSYIIPRTQIAWTSTTDDGASFARHYLQGNARYDYLSYDDEM